jgi:hypothetical protein
MIPVLTNRKTVTGKALVLSVVFTLLFSIWTSSAGIAATVDPNAKAELVISKEIDKSKILLNDEITITYRIEPQPIPATVVEPPKREIYLVMDASSSMDQILSGRQKRIDASRASAVSFLNKLKNDLNKKAGVSVGLITFTKTASIKQELTGNLDVVINKVNGLSLSTGTNIGDGMRRGYYKLKNSPNRDAEKYLILLTDGEPTYHTLESTRSQNFYFGDGNAPHHDGGGYFRSDKDEKYCYEVAERLLKNSGIKSYMIAFTKGSHWNILRQIAEKAGSEYKEAEGAIDLDNVYDQIYDDIIVDFTVENVVFEEIFPAGVEILSAPEGFSIDGQSIKGLLSNIKYEYDSSEKVYKAKPIEFSITIKGTRGGSYLLNSSKLSYTNINGNNETLNFDEKAIEVVALEAPINVSRTLIQDDIFVNESFGVKYSIVPEPFSIDPDITPPEKLIVRNVEFTETLPEGIKLDKVIGASVHVYSNELYSDLKNIEYIYDPTDGTYKADPIVFTLYMMGEEEGDYTLGESIITYTDLDEETKEKSFGGLDATIGKFGIPKIEVVKITKRGEYIDAKLKITLPKRTRYGELRIPAVGEDGTLVKDRDNNALRIGERIDGNADSPTVVEIDYNGLSIYETHRVWVLAVSNLDDGTSSETEIITVFNAIDVN